MDRADRGAGSAITGVVRRVTARDLESLLGASRDYCGLLTQHIAKENDILYPMAEHCVPEEERRPIQEAYAAAALHHGAHALRERFERERDTLRAKLG